MYLLKALDEIFNFIGTAMIYMMMVVIYIMIIIGILVIPHIFMIFKAGISAEFDVMIYIIIMQIAILYGIYFQFDKINEFRKNLHRNM